MAPFRRATRHRPVAQHQANRVETRRAAEHIRRQIEREYLSGLRHLR